MSHAIFQMQLSQSGVSLDMMNRDSMWEVSDDIKWVIVRPSPGPESGNQTQPCSVVGHQSIDVRLGNTYGKQCT